MKLPFSNKSIPGLIGIDISSSAVKMIELDQDESHRYKIAHYAIEPLPRDAVVDGNIIQLDTVIDAVRRGLRRIGSRTKLAALAMPSAAVITKKILAPAELGEDDLEIQVETEATQYIPFPLDEINLDFQIIGPSAGNPDELEILIAASRKEKIEDRVAVAEGAGIRPTIMDVEQYVLQASCSEIRKAWSKEVTAETIALVDIGATLSHLIVLHKDEIVYTREQAFGGDLLTQEIASRYEMSLEEAELAKKHNDLPSDYDIEIFEPFRETVVQEILRLLQFFYSSTHFNKVDHIILAGGGCLLQDLSKKVMEATGVITELANPFTLMTTGPKIKASQFQQDAPMLLVACGLALRKFHP
ncbi:MAG TPA: pilus assembly protein PilM [Burkholderiales bacterium]|nr:pilus assembly protein PilM [Burkholderiales bacterium]